MIPVYDVDGITIYHADCVDILPTIEPDSVGLLLTDPPYGIGTNTDYTSRKRNNAATLNDWPEIREDDDTFDPSHLLPFGRLGQTAFDLNP